MSDEIKEIIFKLSEGVHFLDEQIISSDNDELINSLKILRKDIIKTIEEYEKLYRK